MKKIMAVFLALIMLLGISGYFVQAAELPKPRELVFANQDWPTILRSANLQIGAFERITGIKVKMVTFPYGTMNEKYMTALRAAGTAPWAVMEIEDGFIPQAASKEWLVPLDKELGFEAEPDLLFMGGSFWPPKVGPVPPGQEGKPHRIYTIPVQSASHIWAYRQDLLKEAGMEPPDTWDDVLELAKKFYDPSKPFYGITREIGGPGRPYVELMGVLYSYGGKFFDDEWNPVFNSPEGVAAVKMYMEQLKYANPGILGMDDYTVLMEFSAGRAFQIETDTCQPGAFMESVAMSRVVGKIGYSMMPKGSAMRAARVGGWSLGIPRGLDPARKYWAGEFIRFCTGQYGQLLHALAGGAAIRTSVLGDPWMLERYAYYKAALDQMTKGTGIWRPRTEHAGAVEDIVNKVLVEIYQGEKTPEAGLNEAAEKVKLFLQMKGYYK